MSAWPPAQAASTDSADVPAIAGSVWVASASSATMLAITLGSASTGKVSATDSGAGLGLRGRAVTVVSFRQGVTQAAAVWKHHRRAAGLRLPSRTAPNRNRSGGTKVVPHFLAASYAAR